MLHDFLTEICKEQRILIEFLSQGYIIRLSKNDQVRHIIGPYWEINNTASDRIACDKYGCYQVLESRGIPAIQHEILQNPLRRPNWSGPYGSWSQALDLFTSFNSRVVVKPNTGSYGKDIYFANTICELETGMQAIFAYHASAAISPYHEIKNEYRVFYLNGECRFAYGKEKNELGTHNLAAGASAFMLDEQKDAALITQITSLATNAANCIGINFASVDVADTEQGFKIMEINAGVQAGILLEQHPDLHHMFKNILTDAVLGMFRL